MEPIKSIIKRNRLYLYLKYQKEIDEHYGYALKNGYASNDDADWQERLDFWRRSE